MAVEACIEKHCSCHHGLLIRCRLLTCSLCNNAHCLHTRCLYASLLCTHSQLAQPDSGNVACCDVSIPATLPCSSAATFNIKAEVHGNGHRVAPHHLAALTPDEHLGSLSWSPQLAAERNARRSSSGAQAGPGGGQGKRKVVPLPEHVAFWPLTQQLEGSELLVQVSGDVVHQLLSNLMFPTTMCQV